MLPKFVELAGFLDCWQERDLPKTWEKDLLSGEIQFCIREDEKVYIGKGETCREAFANKYCLGENNKKD